MRYLLFVAVICGIWTSCNIREQSTSVDQPNVLLIMTDDQGWGDLSIHGNPYVETPHIDALAKTGTQFDRFYVSPVCAPTRASLLTGKYHQRTGTTWVTHRKEVMRTEEVTIAEHLKAAGYTTGIFGKWHNGEQYPNDPNAQGFDEFYGFASGHWNNYFDTPLRHNYEEVTSAGWIIDDLTDKALGFMEKATVDNSPFFCYIPYNTPHGPFQVPDQYFDKYKAKGLNDKDACIYGMIENIDDNIGKLISYLDDHALRNNTIVIFLTDNGPNGVRYNGQMRGTKGHVYEGGVRVPFFLNQPGQIPRDHVVREHGSHIDLLPTLMTLTGTSTTLEDIDGIDLTRWILDPDQPVDNTRIIYTSQTSGIKRAYPLSARNGRYTYVINPSNEHELFDLVNDPQQTTNRIKDLPVVAAALRDSTLNYFEYITLDNPYQAPPTPVGYNAHRQVHMPAHEASLSGGLSFQGGMGWANDYVINWKKGDSMTWPIDVKQAMVYEVEVLYSAETTASWSLRAGDEKYMIQLIANTASPIPSPDRVPRGEVYAKEWSRSLPIKLMINSEVTSLSIASDNTDPSIEIKGIRLTPVQAI